MRIGNLVGPFCFAVAPLHMVLALGLRDLGGGRVWPLF